jgi:hypothetical protein
MSGKLPIDRVREAQDAPAIYDEHRERFAQKQAKLEQTNELSEGERPPHQSRVADPDEIPPANVPDEPLTVRRSGDEEAVDETGQDAGEGEPR